MSAQHALSFRPMALSDLDKVLEVETRAYAFPWSRGIFTDCLSAGYDCRVALVEQRIVGHAVMSSAAGESHLLNVCVQRDQQGQGIGRALVEHVVHRSRTLGSEVLLLEVRPTNIVALRLYDTLGFVQIGTRKDYYPAALGREDAWVLMLKLTEPVDSLTPV